MKKIQIVEGIMSIVGKISTMVAKLVKSSTKVVAIEDVGSQAPEPVGKLRLKNPLVLKEKKAKEEKEALRKLEVFKHLQELKVEEDLAKKQEQLQDMKVVHIDGCKKKSPMGRRKLGSSLALGNLQIHSMETTGYKNKGVTLPLHRDQLTEHKVIYLHQRAPTYRMQERERTRKRGTGT